MSNIITDNHLRVFWYITVSFITVKAEENQTNLHIFEAVTCLSVQGQSSNFITTITENFTKIQAS